MQKALTIVVFVYAHQGTPIGNIIRGLVLIYYQALDSDEMRNHLEFL